MSDFDPTAPKPIVLRVEISAEQAAFLAPFLGPRTDPAPQPSLPSTPSVPSLPSLPSMANVPSLPSVPDLGLSDEAADARVNELRRRETDLAEREAEFEADVQFREDRIARWRTELEELEQTLERRERDLVSYVDQLQGAMSGSNDAWWSRPAGGDGGVR